MNWWIKNSIVLLACLSVLAAAGAGGVAYCFFGWAVGLTVGSVVGLLALVESAAALTICFVVQEVFDAQ